VGTVKSDADALRLGLIVGLIDRQHVVAWADQLIRSDRVAEAPVVLDLAVATHHSVADVVSLLHQVPGDVDRATVGRRLATQLRGALACGTLDVVGVARAMYRVLHEGYAPDHEFESMAYWADDGVDLALQGVYGSLDQVRAELEGFLARYVE
jgi:hypothetical protein